MDACKYLESIGLENVINEEFFNGDDKSWYKVQELMESYHQFKLKNNGGLGDVVGRSEQLCECDDEDDTIPLRWFCTECNKEWKP